MSGFKYTTAGAGGSFFRHYLALTGKMRHSHTGSFLIPNVDSKPAGSTVTVTGVGFQPDALLIFDAITTSGSQFLDSGDLGIGMTDGTNQWAGHAYMADLSSYVECDWRDDAVIANAVYASIASFDADGFTLNIDANNLPSGGSDNYFAYMAMKGGGGYACGTELAPAATGTQSISGLGFQPTAIFVASTMRDALSLTTDYARYVFGGSDLVNGQWNVWTSYTAPAGGDVYVDELATSGKLITFGVDSDLNPPFAPVVTAEAELQSFDADGFTLDWTTADGTQRYYSWFAVDGDAEANRWLYNHGNFETHFIKTRKCPKALIFYMNGNGQDSSFNHEDNLGSGISIGCCDEDNDQRLAGYLEASEPAFSVMRSVREMRSDCAFGAYGPVAGGVLTTTPNNQGGRGTVAIRCGRDHLLRLHVAQ